jgi:hypothetical protein
MGNHKNCKQEQLIKLLRGCQHLQHQWMPEWRGWQNLQLKEE